MSRQNTNITQAKIERAIRAAKAEGLYVVRIVAQADGYVIETASSARTIAEPSTNKPRLVL